MKRLLKFIVIMVLGFVLYLSVNYGITQQHELVHEEIFNDFNISYTKHIEPIYSLKEVGGYVMPINASEYYQKCNSDCINQNNLNEIITYNNSSVISSIFIALFILLVYLQFNSPFDKNAFGGRQDIK